MIGVKSNQKINIFAGKAVIKPNRFGVWQFRMWVSSDKKYSKITTHKSAEELYIKLPNEVAGINCVVYDIISKPPGTIERE